MYRIFITALVITLFFPAAFADFKAGIACRDVTPDPLLPVSGGVGPSEPATETKGRLNVRALAISDDDTNVAIVSIDFLGVTSTFVEQVAAQVNGIPKENIMIGATHTHSAPDMYGFPDQEGNFSLDKQYFDRVCMQTAEAINAAFTERKSAHIKINTGKAEGQIAYNYYAPQLYDPRCHVMQFISQEGEPIATLVNYAIHPEVIGNDEGILSPDMVGPLYERIEVKSGGTAIFMNSALGGMVTADNRREGRDEVQTWEECIRIGNQLADEALRIISDAPLQTDPQLDCFAKQVLFPIDSPLLRKVVEVSPLGYPLNEQGQISTRLNVMNLGNAQVVTIPGEALPNIGYYLKRKMKGEHNFLFGLTNDAFGYILTKEDFNSFERYDYISRTSLGENTGEIYMDEILAMVNQHPAPNN